MDNINNTTGLTGVIEPIVKLLTVEECGICAEQNFLICDACWAEFFQLTYATCYSCGARSDDHKTCPDCRKRSVKPKTFWSVVRYSDEAKRLVHRMKLDCDRDAARFIARKLNETIPLIDFDAVTYVPSSTRRIRQRSYDHSRLIASELAKLRNIQFEKTLKRIGHSRQVGKSRTERRAQAEYSYESIRGSSYQRILLVDDVISTGATIEACTRLLRRAGVRQVDAACFARR